MAQITTVALPQYTIPKTKPSRQARSITTRFSPTELAANVTSGDTILLATLSKDARVIASGVRMVGVSGLSLAFVNLQVNENSTIFTLTNPLSATTAGNVGQNSAPPTCVTTYTKALELLVGGNSIDSTATGIIEVSVHYDYYAEAG